MRSGGYKIQLLRELQNTSGGAMLNIRGMKHDSY